MPEKILGLDISDDAITAVQVEGGLKGYHILACAHIRIEGDDSLDDALRELFEQQDLRSDVCLASIPGEHVSYRNLRMPFKDAKKIRQTLPFEVETMVPFPIDDLVIDFTINDRSDQSEILAVSARKELISGYLAHLQSHSVDPDVLDIRCVPTVSLLLKQEGTPDNGLFLEMGERRSTMVLFLKRRMALIRSFSFNAPAFGSTANGDHAETPTREQAESWFESFCTMVENTIHSIGCQSNREVRPEAVFFTGVGARYPETADLLTRFLGVPAQEIDLSKDRKINMGESVARVWNPVLMDNALALSLRNGKQGQGFNFRKDEFEIKKRGFWLQKEFRRAMIFLGVILCLLFVDMGVDFYFLKERYRMLDQRVTEVFSRTFPDVKRIVDPLQQMKVKVNEVKTSAISIPGTNSTNKVLDLLKDISERIPKSLDVHVTRMVIDQETVRVSGKTDTFNTVDSVKSGLEPSKYFSGVTISSANLDRTGKRVQFEIKLQRKK